MLLRSNDPKDDMNEVRFVDTTLRDGQQSLWALSMKTGMMLPVAEQMDRAGFDAIELMASSHFKKCVRELKDDPWERIRLVAQRIKKTPLRMSAGRINAFEITPLSVYSLFLERMADRLAQTLLEASRVRAEFGYPIMVTPLSQFVGSQAAINVILGARYKEVTDQVIQYALGLWGKEGADTMDPNVKDKILGRPRARELARWEPPEPSIQEIRSKMGGSGVTDEELLLRWALRKEDIEAMRVAGPPKEYISARHPLVTLVHELTKRKDYRQIQVQKPGMSLILEKRQL